MLIRLLDMTVDVLVVTFRRLLTKRVPVARPSESVEADMPALKLAASDPLKSSLHLLSRLVTRNGDLRVSDAHHEAHVIQALFDRWGVKDGASK
jgi:hypothetical protein